MDLKYTSALTALISISPKCTLLWKIIFSSCHSKNIYKACFMVQVLGIQNNVLKELLIFLVFKELLIFLVLKELLIFIEHLLNAKLCPRCVTYNIINSRNIIAIMFPFLKIRKPRLTGQELYPKAWLGSDRAGI